MRRGALVFNPAAGARRGPRLASRVAAVLEREGWRVELAPTAAPGHATELARRFASAGEVEAVFALGGDGTFREVGAGLLGSTVALAPLPAGTANVLARSLGIPLAPLAAAHALAGGRRRALAVALCGATPFLMMASAGMDAAVVAAMGGPLKARLGMAGVALQGLGTWWSYAYPPVVARWDGREAKAAFVVVANIPHYGGPFVIAPRARHEEPSLELLLHEGVGRLGSLRFALDLLRGRHLERADVACHRVEEVTLDADAGVRLQVDGDRCDEPFPVVVRPAETTLSVLAPEPG